MSSSRFQLHLAKRALELGHLIAYPTESVIGLGCDPNNSQAIEQLLSIKQRHAQKGLILVASDVTQLEPWVDFNQLTNTKEIFESWPGPETWVVPTYSHVSPLLTGGRNTIAVRVSKHETIVQLCEKFEGAITSTSANLSGRPTTTTMLAARKVFNSRINFYLYGHTSRAPKPSRIRNALTGQTLRD